MDEDIEHKVLIIGPPKAGKTVFIARYVHDVFYSGDLYKQTFGVDFSLKHLERNGEKITLQLWDIAGQERTQTMSRMYYQDAHACIIMFDLTYEWSLDICKKWKDDLDSKCTLEDGSALPCILLANKSDLPNRKFSAEEIERFAKEQKFIGYKETSVKENINVNESMNFLVDHLMAKEHCQTSDCADTVDLSKTSTNGNKQSGCNC